MQTMTHAAPETFTAQQYKHSTCSDAQKLPITSVKINDYLWTCSTLLRIEDHQRAVAAAFKHNQTINLYFNGSCFHLSCVPPLNLEQDLWG